MKDIKKKEKKTCAGTSNPNAFQLQYFFFIFYFCSKKQNDQPALQPRWARCWSNCARAQSQTAQLQPSTLVLMNSELPSHGCRAGRVPPIETHNSSEKNKTHWAFLLGLRQQHLLGYQSPVPHWTWNFDFIFYISQTIGPFLFEVTSPLSFDLDHLDF